MNKLSLILLVNLIVLNVYADSFRDDLAFLYSQGELDKAIVLCKKQMHNSEDSRFYYLNLALLYEEAGNINEAISVLKQAYLKYKDEDIIFHLGRMYFLSSQNKESIYFLTEYTSRSPRDEKAYFYLGLNYEDLNKTNAAIGHYQKSLELDPYFILPLVRMSHIYFENNNLNMAAKYANKIKKLEPSVKSAYKILALSSYRSKDYVSSFRESDKFLNMVPADKEIMLVHRSSKKKLGEDYFIREREKTRKSRKDKLMTVGSYVDDKAIPEVKIQIAEQIDSFEFKSTKGSVLYRKGLPVFKFQKNTLYKFSLSKYKNLLNLTDSRGRIIARDLQPPVVLKADNPVSLFGVFGLKHAEGTYWSKTLDNFFRGNLEVKILSGRMRLINTLNLEEYLYGVVPAEVSSSWPDEALCAQAVVARTRAYKALGTHRRNGFDFCNTVHCQVYLGASSERTSTNLAVDKTRGLILTYGDKPLDIYYSSNCGGHTQASEQFLGVKDTDRRLEFSFPLTPLELYRWLTREPDVFCRQKARERSRFRWQRIYSSGELDKIVTRSSSLADVERLSVLKRNVSGHINSLKIESSSGQEIIDSEFDIRKTLDDLRSSLFRAEIKYTKEQKPQYFIFWGGGFGHGMGLCQYGVKGMADKGYSYKRILRHYFPQSTLKKTY